MCRLFYSSSSLFDRVFARACLEDSTYEGRSVDDTYIVSQARRLVA